MFWTIAWMVIEVSESLVREGDIRSIFHQNREKIEVGPNNFSGCSLERQTPTGRQVGSFNNGGNMEDKRINHMSAFSLSVAHTFKPGQSWKGAHLHVSPFFSTNRRKKKLCRKKNNVALVNKFRALLKWGVLEVGGADCSFLFNRKNYHSDLLWGKVRLSAMGNRRNYRSEKEALFISLGELFIFFFGPFPFRGQSRKIYNGGGTMDENNADDSTWNETTFVIISTWPWVKSKDEQGCGQQHFSKPW